MKRGSPQWLFTEITTMKYRARVLTTLIKFIRVIMESFVMTTKLESNQNRMNRIVKTILRKVDRRVCDIRHIHDIVRILLTVFNFCCCEFIYCSFSLLKHRRLFYPVPNLTFRAIPCGSRCTFNFLIQHLSSLVSGDTIRGMGESIVSRVSQSKHFMSHLRCGLNQLY